MNTKTLYIFILVLIYISLSQNLSAQNSSPKYEVGAHGSMFVYQGDLTSYKLGSRKTKKYGFGGFAAYRLNDYFSIRANFAHGKLEGDDEKYPNPRFARKFKFNSPVTELSGLIVWDILSVGNYKDPTNIFPYLMGGVGYTFLDIERDFSGNTFGPTHPSTVGLEEDIPQTLPKQIPVFAVGLGVRRYLSERLSVNVELLHRITTTDYLDGFSEAADPSNNDSYYTLSLGLIYSFPRSDGGGGGAQFKRGKNKRGRIDCPVYN